MMLSELDSCSSFVREKDDVIGELARRMGREPPSSKIGHRSRRGDSFELSSDEWTSDNCCSHHNEQNLNKAVAQISLSPQIKRREQSKSPNRMLSNRSVSNHTTTLKSSGTMSASSRSISTQSRARGTGLRDHNLMSNGNSSLSSSLSSMASIKSGYSRQNSNAQNNRTATNKAPVQPNRMATSLGLNRSAVNKSTAFSNNRNVTRSSAAAPRSTTNTSSFASSARKTSSSSLSRVSSNNAIDKTMLLEPDVLNNPELMAKIGNRALKQVQRSVGKCHACNKPINEDGCTAFGEVYHKGCFKCCVCKQRISGKFFERDGQIYCTKDYQKLLEHCCVCGQVITGDSVVANDKHYHPECMKCYICGVQLRGTYFTFQDQPICQQDYKRVADKCSSCGETVSGQYYSVDDKIFCASCHDENCEMCVKCGEPISGRVLHITNAAFHPACFKCSICKCDLVNKTFYSDDKHNVFCPDDYNKSKAAKCAHCKKPIVPKEGKRSAPRIRALDKDYHPECFRCEDCGMLFDAKVKGKECYPFRKHALCIKCNRKKISDEDSD